MQTPRPGAIRALWAESAGRGEGRKGREPPDPDSQPRGEHRRPRERFSAGKPRGRRWPQPQAERPRAGASVSSQRNVAPAPRSLPGPDSPLREAPGRGPQQGLQRRQRPQPSLRGGGRSVSFKDKHPPQGNRHLPLHSRFRVCKELRRRLPAGWAGPEPELSGSAMGAGPSPAARPVQGQRGGGAGAKRQPWLLASRSYWGQPFLVHCV